MAPCSIKWCGKESKTSNFKTDGITFHRYPKDAKIKEKWINATRRENWFPSEYSVICSLHFTQDCFLEMKNRRRLLSSAVPSRRLPLLSDSEKTACEVHSVTPDLKTAEPKTSSSPVARHKNRTEHKKRKRLSESPSTSFAPPKSDISETPISKKIKTVCESPLKYDISIKKRLSRRIIELTDKIVQKNRLLKNFRQKNIYLKKKLSSIKSIVSELLNINPSHCQSESKTKTNATRHSRKRRLTC